MPPRPILDQQPPRAGTLSQDGCSRQMTRPKRYLLPAITPTPAVRRPRAAWMTSLFALVTCMAARAQTAPAEKPLIAHLDGDAFKEALKDEAPVAGADIVGLIVQSSHDNSDARKLYVRNPARSISKVCVEITTLNGAYVASNTYLMPKAARGAYVEIPFNASRPLGTSHPEFFSSTLVQSLAVLTRTGACTDRSPALLPTAWGRPASSDTRLSITLAVQSGRATMSVLAKSPGETDGTCQSLTQGRRTAFDTLCTVQVPQQGPAEVELSLQRCAFDDCSGPLTVKVVL